MSTKNTSNRSVAKIGEQQATNRPYQSYKPNPFVLTPPVALLLEVTLKR